MSLCHQTNFNNISADSVDIILDQCSHSTRHFPNLCIAANHAVDTDDDAAFKIALKHDGILQMALDRSIKKGGIGRIKAVLSRMRSIYSQSKFVCVPCFTFFWYGRMKKYPPRSKHPVRTDTWMWSITSWKNTRRAIIPYTWRSPPYTYMWDCATFYFRNLQSTIGTAS